jgi:hypothetical protein
MSKLKLINSGAEFSPCRKWRYALWRNWEEGNNRKSVMFVGLNPSIADEVENDATIRKCIGFAQRWGYSGIYMVNLFAFVATKPSHMAAFDDPIGPGNDASISKYRQDVERVIAAWGSVDRRFRNKLNWNNRINQVLKLVRTPVECLGTTLDGSPFHPSRLSYMKERIAYQLNE